jgi:hypothetical protein
MRIALGSRFASLGKEARVLTAAAENELHGDDVVIVEGGGSTGGTSTQHADEPDPVTDPAPEPDPAPDASASERARVSAVAQSEHTVGRERQALNMLGTSMSAEEITGLLATMPKGGGGAADAMLERLTSQPNPELGAGDDTDTSRASAGDFWAKIRGTRGS